MKLEDGDAEKIEDLVEPNGVAWDNFSLSVGLESSTFVVVILEFSNAYSFLECVDNAGGVTDVVGDVLLALAAVGVDC